jgi:hypothetical protein
MREKVKINVLVERAVSKGKLELFRKHLKAWKLKKDSEPDYHTHPRGALNCAIKRYTLEYTPEQSKAVFQTMAFEMMSMGVFRKANSYVVLNEKQQATYDNWIRLYKLRNI